MRLALLSASCFALSCSFTTATGFNDCSIDTECQASQACVEHYCIHLTEGCTRGPGDFTSPDHIAFGVVIPLTDAMGTVSQGQKASLDAYTMALDEMNGLGGASNMRKFALYVCDSQSGTADKSKAQAEFLAQQLKVPAMFSSGSAQSLVVASATRDAGTMVMSPRATSPQLVDDFAAQTDSLLWRTAPPDSLQGRVLANLILTDPAYTGVTNVGIIYVQDAYGSGLQRELASRLRAASRMVTTAPFMATDDASIMAAVTMIAGTSPNATVVIAFSDDTKRILTAALPNPKFQRAMGHKWAFADGAKNPLILTAPNASTEIVGALGTAPAQGAGSVFLTFRDAYQTKFMRDPSAFAYTSHSYDAMYLLGVAATYATSGGRTLDGRTMANAMNKVSMGNKLTIEPSSFSAMRNAISADTSIDVEGNSGKLDFIPDAGAPLALIEEWRIEADAGFTTVGLIDPPPN